MCFFYGSSLRYVFFSIEYFLSFVLFLFMKILFMLTSEFYVFFFIVRLPLLFLTPPFFLSPFTFFVSLHLLWLASHFFDSLYFFWLPSLFLSPLTYFDPPYLFCLPSLFFDFFRQKKWRETKESDGSQNKWGESKKKGGSQKKVREDER